MEYTPERFAAGLKKVSRQQWWAFAGAWAAGLFAHGYMLANKLPNHDDLSCFWTKGASYTSGRWALDLVGWLDGSFSMPWMLGLTALLLLSVGAMFIVDILRLKSPLFCGLAGAVLAVFPSVISLFAYMFASDAYMLSFLLAVLCAWLCGRGGWYRLAAVGCLVFSLGLYQGFLGWAAALMVYTLLARCLEEGAEVKPVFVDGLWDVGVLAAGVAGYLGVTKLIWAAAGFTPGEYQGISQMGRIDPALLPQQLWSCYSLFFNTFRSPTEGVCTTAGLRFLLTGCQWLAILLIAAAAARQLARGKWLQAALAALLGLLMPIAIGIVYLMNSGYVHTLMVYPMCMIPLVALAQCESWDAKRAPDAKAMQNRLHTLGRWACVCLVALLAGRYARQANEAYLCLQVNHSRRLSYWTTVVTQIKSLPGYDQWLPVVFINESGWDRSTPGVWDSEEFNDLVGIRMPVHTYSDQQFLELYAGFCTEFLEPAEYAGLPEVQAIPPYPASGSIRIVEKGGVLAVVVKF